MARTTCSWVRCCFVSGRSKQCVTPDGQQFVDQCVGVSWQSVMHGAIQPWCEIGLAVGVLMCRFHPQRSSWQMLRSCCRRRCRYSVVAASGSFVAADSAQHEAQGHRAAAQQTRMLPQHAAQKHDRRDGARSPNANSGGITSTNRSNADSSVVTLSSQGLDDRWPAAAATCQTARTIEPSTGLSPGKTTPLADGRSGRLRRGSGCRCAVPPLAALGNPRRVSLVANLAQLCLPILHAPARSAACVPPRLP